MKKSAFTAPMLAGALAAPLGLATSVAPIALAAPTTSTTTERLAVSPASVAAMKVRPPNRFATSFPTVKAGSPWQDIRAVQYLLQDTGRKTDLATSYSASTASAVKNFQSANKLPATGIADSATLARLTSTAKAGQKRSSTLAVQTLLSKHGYTWQTPGAPQLSSQYGAVTDQQVRAFQLGHAIIPTNVVGTYTWRTLFAAKTSGPLFGIDQHGTGGAWQANCGPASALALLLTKGVAPAQWTGSLSSRGAAVDYFRRVTARVTYADRYGTESTQLVPAFARLGIASSAGGSTEAIAAAKAGRPSLVAGDTEFLTWKPWGGRPYSHYLAVLGWDGAQLIAMDPWTGTLHRMTPAQLQRFTSKQVGPKETGNMLPPSRAGVVVK